MDYAYAAASVTVDVNVLFNVLLAICGAFALIALGIFFIKALGTVNRINKLIDDVSPDVIKTVEKLPETVDG